MRNQPIGRHEAEDISAQVKKVLRGLGNPEPPLDLTQVRDLLRLDRHYYTASDTGFLRDFVNRLTVGTKRVFKDPIRLVEAVKRFSLRALWIPKDQRILIDADTPKIKQRWAESHEIVHSITEWHARYLLGDDRETLRASCHLQIEAEANYGTGQLLFLQERFVQEATSTPLSMKQVSSLAKSFGNTITSTLWRVVEEAHHGLPMFGVVSVHPIRNPGAATPCRYVIESPAFREKFSGTSDGEIFDILQTYCSGKSGGPLGETEAILTDTHGERHVFWLESFCIKHEVLTLGLYKKRAEIVTSVP